MRNGRNVKVGTKEQGNGIKGEGERWEGRRREGSGVDLACESPPYTCARKLYFSSLRVVVVYCRCVRADGCDSDWFLTGRGVQQGGVLALWTGYT